MSKFGKFKPGDAPVFKADSVNAWQEVARWYSESNFGGKGNQTLGGVNAPPALHVSVEASSFTTFGAVLTPTGIAANDPATHPLEARRRPCVTAATPASADDAIVIVSEPAVSAGTGDPGLARAVVQGVAVCRVLVADPSHRYARPEPGNSEYLVSDEYGPALLLVPTGAGTVGTDAEPEQTLVLLSGTHPVVVVEDERPLDPMPCLVKAGDEVVGLAQRWYDPATGVAECRTSGFCGCPPEDPPSVETSCCSLWYCTLEDGPVEVTADEDGEYHPPEDWDGSDPHTSEEEAEAACPTPVDEPPTCTDVPPESLPDLLTGTLTGDPGQCDCAQAVDMPFARTPPDEIWMWEHDASCGLTYSLALSCDGGAYTLGVPNVWSGNPDYPTGQAYTPVGGTASPFSLTFEVSAHLLCPGNPPGTLTLVVSE